MTLLGKILLGLNLLLAGLFSYLALKDWHLRQNVQAAALRYPILVQGLPFGDEPDAPSALPAEPDEPVPFPVLGVGHIPTQTVNRKLLESYFQRIPGGPAVPHQLAEVRRVRGRVEQLLNEAATPEAKLQLLRSWLLLQPYSYEERQTLLQAFAKADIEELQKNLLARFDAVLNPPQSATLAPLADDELAGQPPEEARRTLQQQLEQVQQSYNTAIDPIERRARAAHLLVHLDPAPDWQNRVAAVVGLQQYARVVAAQARRIEDMNQRLRQMIVADQAIFLQRIEPLMLRARDATELANRQAQLKARWVEQVAREADFVAQRETHLREITDNFNRAKAEVDALLVRQSGIEAEMFAVQQQVAAALEQMYRLYGELVALENQLQQQQLRPRD